MENKKKEKDSKTAGENVYNFLRTSIIELRVKPGQIINIKELSEFLKVSRSPIRDALIQLGKDGLVTTTPQKGTVVSKIDVPRVNEERFLRACIEERIMIEFLRIYKASDLDRLREILTQQRQAAANNDARGFLRYDDLFHSVFFEVTNRPFCLKVVQNMSGHYYRIRLLSLSEEGTRNQTLSQHEEILQLVLKKDTERLGKLLDAHILEKETEENGLKTKYPDLFTGVSASRPKKKKIWESDFLKTI